MVNPVFQAQGFQQGENTRVLDGCFSFLKNGYKGFAHDKREYCAMEGIGDDAEGFLEGLQEFIRIRGDGIFFRDAAFRSLERDDAERGAHFFPYFFHLLPGKPGKLVDVEKISQDARFGKVRRPSFRQPAVFPAVQEQCGVQNNFNFFCAGFPAYFHPVFFPYGNGGEFREFPLSQSKPFRGLLPPCRAGGIGYALAGRGEIQEFFRFAGCPYLVAARQVCVKIQFLRVEFSGEENGGQGMYLLFNKGFK